MKSTLHLYNNGHSYESTFGKGGLGYHPMRIRGSGKYDMMPSRKNKEGRRDYENIQAMLSGLDEEEEKEEIEELTRLALEYEQDELDEEERLRNIEEQVKFNRHFDMKAKVFEALHKNKAHEQNKAIEQAVKAQELIDEANMLERSEIEKAVRAQEQIDRLASINRIHDTSTPEPPMTEAEQRAHKKFIAQSFSFDPYEVYDPDEDDDDDADADVDLFLDIPTAEKKAKKKAKKYDEDEMDKEMARFMKSLGKKELGLSKVQLKEAIPKPGKAGTSELLYAKAEEAIHKKVREGKSNSEILKEIIKEHPEWGEHAYYVLRESNEMGLTEGKEKISSFDISDDSEIADEIRDLDNQMFDTIFTEVRETDLLDESLDEGELQSSEELSKEAIDKTVALDYLETVEIGGQPLPHKLESYYESGGKKFETATCGEDNEVSNILFDVHKSNFQVSDFVVDNIFVSIVKPKLEAYREEQIKRGVPTKELIAIPEGAMGGSFCLDLLDIENAIAVELKDYTHINYEAQYNMNIEFKREFRDRLIKEMRDRMIDYSLDDEHSHIERIQEIHSLLTSKDRFEKEFYRTQPYYGVGITMNKWSKVITTASPDSTTTSAQRAFIRKSQGQVYEPIFTNRKLTGLKCDVGKKSNQDKYKEVMTEALMTHVLKRRAFKYYLSARVKGGIGVYDYTQDSLVDNDDILATYKATVSGFGSIKKYDSVSIPIEKLILKGR